MAFKITTFNLNLPFGIGGVSVVRTEAQRTAAWSLYVEYATRIATQRLAVGQGSAREALDSLHSLFGATRAVLKDLEPSVAEGPESVGVLAIRILNEGVRPFLVEWHTRLSGFETEQRLLQQEQGMRNFVIDDAQWGEREEFYEALEEFRVDMQTFVGALAELAGVAGDE